MIEKFDAIVLGGGAAGLMCAIEAGKRGRRVVVLERADRVGKKILISGGGRCNFTNLHCRPENFLSSNPHFCKSALARYTPADFIALVEKHGIRYHEKHKGQLFCDGSAREIVAMLEEECRRAGVRIVVGASVREVRQDTRLRDSGRRTRVPCGRVGGCYGRAINSENRRDLHSAMKLARQFGIRVKRCRPALVPLLFHAEDRSAYGELAGVSTEVRVSCDSQEFTEKMLFTHRGLSGPAILQISSYWREGQAIVIDLVPVQDWVTPLRTSSSGRDLSAAKQALPRGVAAATGGPLA